MANLHLVRQDDGEIVRVGHTVEISKVIEITDILSTNSYKGSAFVKGDDGKRYLVGTEWDFKFATPKTWPPRPGDVWKTNDVKYAAIARGDIIVLEPMTTNDRNVVLPSDFGSFLAQNPILVYRER